MASLQVLKGPNPGTTLPLLGERIVLGRNADCQIVINLPAVSREHALIRLVNGDYWIEDLGSRNGTLVNNREIRERTRLAGSDQIKICDSLYQFVDSAIPPLPEGLRRGGLSGRASGARRGGRHGSTVEVTLGPGSRPLLEAQPAEKLAMLLDLSVELSQTFDLDLLLPKIVDSLFQVFRQADRGFIILRDEASRKLIRG